MDTRRMWDRIKKSIQEEADLVLVVLDARDPLGTRPKRVEEFMAKWGKAKTCLFVLNKVDAVPRDVIAEWRQFFKAQGVPVITFSGKKRWGLRKLMNQIYRHVPSRKGSRVLLVGYPNVGKSTIINVLLKGKKHVSTSSQAGHTRGLQLIKLEGLKDIYLVDSPGVVPYSESSSQIELALKGAMMPAKLDDPMAVVEHIFFERVDQEILKRIYDVEFNPGDLDDFLEKLGRKRGRLLKGGRVNVRQVCVEFVRDWQQGKLPYWIRPPKTA
ncbi:MAG: YlqF/YawG family GTPase [Promethearchaeota archaeon]